MEATCDADEFVPSCQYSFWKTSAVTGKGLQQRQYLS